MPPTGDSPGGAGEFSVAPWMAATACAYARATGTLPTSVPVNHNRSDQIKAQGRDVTDVDLDEIRNMCRCGTYPRIRRAIKAAAAKM